jgi:putative ABC transport system substrate-binding protein
MPVAARAQQSAMPVIGILGIGAEKTNNFPANESSAFLDGLRAMGYADGRNVAFEFRWTEQFDQLPALAADLVRRRVAVIYTIGNANAALAAKAATATIPIVFTIGADPVRLGLVESLSRPSRNATGVSFFGTLLGPKRLEMLRELVPQATTIAVLVNPTNPGSDTEVADVKVAAAGIGQQITVLTAGNRDEIDAAFAEIAGRGAGALLVTGDALFYARRDQLAALAASYRIPTTYFNRGFVEAGGLMSYSDDRPESHRQAATYVGRILGGEKPADLPVLQPTKFDMAINVKTAKLLGLTFPPSFFLRAERVIE